MNRDTQDFSTILHSSRATGSTTATATITPQGNPHMEALHVGGTAGGGIVTLELLDSADAVLDSTTVDMTTDKSGFSWEPIARATGGLKAKITNATTSCSIKFSAGVR